MNKVSVLDCTLRHGGYVNDFNFSKATIKTVINKLGQAHIDIIECGFIRDTEYDENRSVFSQVEQITPFITPKKKPPKGITEYLHNLGLGAGEKNMSRIAAANCRAKEVRKALFALAEEEKLILPTDLNPWEETEQ